MTSKILFTGTWLACLILLVTAAPALAQCSGSGTPIEIDGTQAGAHPSIAGITNGNVTGSAVLSASNIYILQNAVEVKDGGSLTIPAGTCVFADTNLEPSVLVVRRGGILNLNGTASNPVVLTSANTTEDFDVGSTYQDAAGNPARGDWGGVVMIGNGICNGANDTSGDTDGVTGDCEVEGISDALPGMDGFDVASDANGDGRLTFGGDTNIPGGQGLDNSESSGSITFSRIEYAGFDLLGSVDPQNSGNELNVLVFAGVGNGTTVENVHIRGGLDDGIEIFGGGVNLKNIVITDTADDSFDYSYGWNGNVQFMAIQLPLAAGDRAFEVDGNEDEGGDPTDYQLTPLTDPTIYNVTFIGNGGGDGIKLRRGTGGLLQNFLGAQLGDGFDIDNAETFDGCTGDATGDLFVDNVTLSNGTGVAGTANLYDTDADLETSCTGTGVFVGLAGLGGGAESRTAPVFQPIGNVSGATPSGTFFDASADYRGAIPASGTPFYNIGAWVNF